MKILLRLLIGAGALLLIAYLLPQSMQIAGFKAAAIAALLIGITNITIRPILLLLSLPLTLLTFGLFTIVIDALLLVFVDKLVIGFTLASFGWALVVAVFLAVVKSIGNKVV